MKEGKVKMKPVFAFSIYSETKFYDKGDIIFSDKGETIGRVLKCSEIAIPGEKVFYSYDIEAIKEDYERLKSGEIGLWKMKGYSVHPCSISYYHE